MKAPYPWWCGYPGCAITHECRNGVCRVSEAIENANSAAPSGVDIDRAVPKVRAPDSLRVDRAENETTGDAATNGMHRVPRRMDRGKQAMRVCPGWVDPAWWEWAGPRVRDAKDQAEWIERLALAWCLVRRPDSLTPGQLARQDDYTGRLLGRIFYPTYPIPIGGAQ